MGARYSYMGFGRRDESSNGNGESGNGNGESSSACGDEMRGCEIWDN